MQVRSKVLITGVVLATVLGMVPARLAAAHGSTACLDGTKKESYTASFTRGSGTLKTKNGAALCADAQVTLQSFVVPDSWDGKGFNQTAVPQTMFAVKHITVPKGVANFTQTYSIAVPAACHPTQLDFYVGSEELKLIPREDMHAGEDREILGQLFAATGKCEVPQPPKKIDVCVLSTKTLASIDEKEFDSSKHSKDVKACETPAPKKIEVCVLATKTKAIIEEKAYDAKLHSKDVKVCAVAPVNPPATPPTPTPTPKPQPVTPTPTVQPVKTPEVLPNTGVGNVVMVAGLVAVLGGALHQVVLRFARARQ